ncbi:DUF1801 domain-containing protein [Sporosarcina gallistercoris]|uniref:DUF1801 domain-containing protein n=1 Tax=Sporosarcina gallistercoris TaxID=2762245 RepID=A0ABR8PK66_9BACL|nr:DUF1801 domain-containing protein [Sporosarcina gallistercoris]MBD7908568.1 DUF1801 domain-containing protein [Sporosarcina gallistercoris]
MKIEAETIEEYVGQLPADRQHAIEKLRLVIKENLPPGFEETLSYGMIGYVIPHSIYPDGYHCNPKEPLPFLSMGSQKNFIGVYHMGIYAFPEVRDWFVEEYPKYVKTKLDMAKSCIRFKKMETIPYELIAELCRKITVDDYITHYEHAWKK